MSEPRKTSIMLSSGSITRRQIVSIRHTFAEPRRHSLWLTFIVSFPCDLE